METDLADRLFRSTLGMIDVLTISIGHQLGLYRALDDGPFDADGLAHEAHIHPRFAREWLEQQAVSGLIEHHDGMFSLPREHAPVLLDPDDLSYLAPLADLMAAAAARLPETIEAYRSGGGVSWSAFGPLMRQAQAAGNRPWFLGPLVEDWLPTLDGVDAALHDGGTVLEVGCGEGWAAIGVAQRWPRSRVWGLDIDTPSLVEARRHARELGLEDRVLFVDDPADLPDSRHDLVMALECVHDVPDPVSLLRHMRERVAPGGTVLVVDERAAPTFVAPDDDLQRLLYGWSVLICPPDSMSHPGSAATGTVMRESTLRRYASDAGFVGLDVLPLEHDLWRFYRLRSPVG